MNDFYEIIVMEALRRGEDPTEAVEKAKAALDTVTPITTIGKEE